MVTLKWDIIEKVEGYNIRMIDLTELDEQKFGHLRVNMNEWSRNNPDSSFDECNEKKLYFCANNISGNSIKMPVKGGHSYTWSVSAHYDSDVLSKPATANFFLEKIVTTKFFISKNRKTHSLTGSHDLSLNIEKGPKAYYIKKDSNSFEMYTSDDTFMYLKENHSLDPIPLPFSFSDGKWMKKNMVEGETILSEKNKIQWFDPITCELINEKTVKIKDGEEEKSVTVKSGDFFYKTTLESYIPAFDIMNYMERLPEKIKSGSETTRKEITDAVSRIKSNAENMIEQKQDVIVLKYAQRNTTEHFEKYYYSRNWGWILWERYNGKNSLLETRMFFIQEKFEPTENPKKGHSTPCNVKAEEARKAEEAKKALLEKILCTQCHEKVFKEVAASQFPHGEFVLEECGRCHISGWSPNKQKKEQRSDWEKIENKHYAREHIAIIDKARPSDLFELIITIKGKNGKSAESNKLLFYPATIELYWEDDKKPPSLSGIKAREITKSVFSSAKIIWKTNELSNSLVEYGLSKEYDRVLKSANMTLDHVMPLSGLKHDQVYHFRVKSIDIFGNEAISKDFTLSTKEAVSNAVVKKEESGKVGFQSIQILRFKSENPAMKQKVGIYMTATSSVKYLIEYQKKSEDEDPEEDKHGKKGLTRPIYAATKSCILKECHKGGTSHLVGRMRKNLELPEDIPLVEGNIITCATCHTPHSGKFPYLGRREFNKGVFCPICHSEKG